MSMILIPQYRAARRAAAAGGPVALTFLQSASDASNLTTYTFAAQALGTASAGRYIICAVTQRSGTTGITTSVTIGGVSATSVVAIANTSAGATYAEIFIAAVPTGATGDVVVTNSAGQLRCAIGLWAATSINAISSDTGSSTSDNPSFGVSTVADGCIVACCASSFAGALAWTAPTEKYDNVSEIKHSGASDLTSAGSVTVENDAATIVACCAASWGP